MRRLLLALLLTLPLHADLASTIDDYFSRATAHGFSGAVIVARGESVVLRKGYGLADRQAGRGNRADTAFNIASLDKQFLAAGVLRLEELGKLKTTDTLGRFFEFVPEEKQAITLHQVLTHTAGFPDAYWDEYENLTRFEFVKLVITQRPLVYAPGTDWSYASFDYWLIEEIIERVAGMPFERFLREEFFLPNGMMHTGFALPEWDPSNVARMTLWTIPPEAMPGEGKLAHPLLRPTAWRVMVSTADDLHRWWLALRAGRVLTPASREKLFTPVRDHYAYGWNVVPTTRGTKLIHHGGGGNLGSVVTFRWFVDEDTFVVILNNSITSFQADYAMADVEHLLFGGEGVMPPAPAAFDETAAAKLPGTYRLPHGAKIEVIRAPNGPLVARSLEPEAIDALRFGGVEGGRLAPDALAHEIVTGWSKGQFAPPGRWREHGWTEERLAEWAKKLWTDAVAKLGAFAGVSTIHYRNLFYQGAPETIAFVKIRFAKGDVTLRVFHEASGRVTLDRLRTPEGIEAVLAPAAGGSFTAWDARFGATVRMALRGDRLELTGSGGSVTAMRVTE